MSSSSNTSSTTRRGTDGAADANAACASARQMKPWQQRSNAAKTWRVVSDRWRPASAVSIASLNAPKPTLSSPSFGRSCQYACEGFTPRRHAHAHLKPCRSSANVSLSPGRSGAASCCGGWRSSDCVSLGPRCSSIASCSGTPMLSHSGDVHPLPHVACPPLQPGLPEITQRAAAACTPPLRRGLTGARAYRAKAAATERSRAASGRSAEATVGVGVGV
mmetsp:Transcript_4781/g.14507  ORF Transcript_4781/g.14507 Transcript_4781/m.14507 type:complete len:219 (+) Transcript_4781:469-1125(+)